MQSPSAPGIDAGFDGANTAYPDLFMHMLDAGGQSPANGGDDNAAADADGESEVMLRARNKDCPYCSESVSTLRDKAVALLPCGHAYHVMCGRMILFATGTECTHQECHRTKADMDVALFNRVVDAGVRRGDFTREELEDPIFARNHMVTIRAAMTSERAAEHASSRAERLSQQLACDDERSEEAYEGRWTRNSNMAQKGLSLFQKGIILKPFTMNPSTINKATVTMQALYDMEEALRESARDGSDPSIAVRVVGSGKDTASDMSERISIDRFITAKLSLADIYFGIGLKSWRRACDHGLSTKHITAHEGAFPITGIADLYGVDHSALIDDLGWSLDDIVRMKHTSVELSNVGLTFDHLYLKMGLDKISMAKLGYSPKEWNKILGLDKQYLKRALGITAADFASLGWSAHDVVQAFSLRPIDQQQLGIGAVLTDPARTRTAATMVPERAARLRQFLLDDDPDIPPITAAQTSSAPTSGRRAATVLTLGKR